MSFASCRQGLLLGVALAAYGLQRPTSAQVDQVLRRAGHNAVVSGVFVDPIE